MVKKSQRRNILLIVVPLAVILLTAITVVALQSRSSVWAPSGKTSDETVTKGTAVCLPHKDTSGPQTMECALGMKSESGEYYALSDTDSTYKNVAALPMGEKVEVHGSIEKSTSDTYSTVGTIKVTKIVRD